MSEKDVPTLDNTATLADEGNTLELIREKYDQIAPAYDRMRRSKGHKPYNEFIEQPAMMNALEDALTGKTEQSILELGCGSGVTLEELQQKEWYGEGNTLYGIDFSPNMIELARKANPHLYLETVSADKTSFSSNFFDLVYASLMIHSFEDKGDCFKEVSRILKPGGSFIFTTGHSAGMWTLFGGDYTTMGQARKEEGKITISEEGEHHVFVIGGSYFEEGQMSFPIHDEKRKILATVPTFREHEGTLVRKLAENNLYVVCADPLSPIEEMKEVAPEKYEWTSKVPFFALYKAVKVIP